jgi:hypothetical protein
MGDPWIENFVRWSLPVAGFDLAHVKDQWIAMFFQVVLCDRQPSALQDVVLTMLDYYRMSLKQNNTSCNVAPHAGDVRLQTVTLDSRQRVLQNIRTSC